MAKGMTIDQGFEKLGEILEEMEKEEIGLEESFRLYDQGIKLVRQLKNKLDDTEKKLILLQEEE